MAFSKNQKKIPALIMQVKALQFKNADDFLEVKNLSNSIFKEWVNLKRRYRNKLMNRVKINDRLYAEQEAEEEIVIVIAILLNEKIVNYIVKKLRKFD